MPPIQRKKKVNEKYNPDSFRVISEDAVSDHPKYRPLPYRASFEPRTPTPKASQPKQSNQQPQPSLLKPLKTTRVLPQILPDHRANKPQTKSCGFLDKNVMFLNEPICNVYTHAVQKDEGKWWPSRPNPGELAVPPFARDTHYRNDFEYRQGDRPEGSGRHTSHIDREPALGTVPVNYLREKDGSQRFYKEGMSYEHMYNCRTDTGYPIRGKRHGAFVWSRMDPLSQKKFIDYYQRLEEQERTRTSPTLAEKAQSAVVVRSRQPSQTSKRCHSSVTSLPMRLPPAIMAPKPPTSVTQKEKPAVMPDKPEDVQVKSEVLLEKPETLPEKPKSMPEKPAAMPEKPIDKPSVQEKESDIKQEKVADQKPSVKIEAPLIADQEPQEVKENQETKS